MPRKIHNSTSIHSGAGPDRPTGAKPEEQPGAMTDPAQVKTETAEQVEAEGQNYNYYDDYGDEAGERGRHPLGDAAAPEMDPNAAVQADNDMEGEGYRYRGRLAYGTTEPMTDMAEQAPEGHAGAEGSGDSGGPRSEGTEIRSGER